MEILVLTSKENYVWHSMQEIIPYIERSWLDCATAERKVTILNIDELRLDQIIPLALAANHIVLTCFNHKISRIAGFIRCNLKVPINFVIYVHNMATIAFWPFRIWSGEKFFKENDVFISSCENDRNTVKAVLSGAQVVVSPFYLLGAEENYLNKPFSTISDVVYVGRISTQKNLHNLILAYALLKKKPALKIPKLSLFGKEDDLGSPNMNLKQTGYLNYLKQLVTDLRLTSDIIFLGHQERENINRFLIKNSCLTVSPSLHSDENFGMAILQSLVTGNRCLISDWGGHSDFQKHFGSRVKLLPVINSNWGPSLSAQSICDGLVSILQNPTSVSRVEISEDYRTENLWNKVKDLTALPFSGINLKFTELADSIFRQKQKIYASSPMQIFADYHDPLFHRIAAFYIGSDKTSSAEKGGLVPWVTKSDLNYTIKDPHKGTFQLAAQDENSVRQLYNGGYLIRED